ncbi:hypothetical protein CLV59_104172 [Chitinophaga dinghuensis]|uniref:Uncharacterized protein n=1 Tax=Chitinophaga dinghuensis TaxID=1539050 RepID=A0A327VY75_9BACT|nr:hypothetical protein [Chitinophaga dinghuensis]RAJ81947.1 hypothetical protein CLV59_104172 [Chitinophaga dinghuensis]
MENTEILDLWKNYSQQLEANLQLNKQLTRDITGLKVQSLLASMKPGKVLAVVIGILWCLGVDYLLIHLWSHASLFFLVSALLQSAITSIAIGIYLYQLVLIQQVNMDDPILATQERLARLLSSTLWVARLSWLQLPLWTTFFLSRQLFVENGLPAIIFQILATGLFTGLAIWLFVNIRIDHRDQKWFKLLFRGKEWTPMIKAMDMIDKIEDYKSE